MPSVFAASLAHPCKGCMMCDCPPFPRAHTHAPTHRYRDFLRMASAQLRLGVPYFIEREVGELVRPSTLLALLPLLTTVNPANLLGTHIDRLKQFFKDPRLLAAFSFQDL